MADSVVIGVDIGGSHITCMGIDPSSRTIFSDRAVREHVDSSADSESILGAWAKALHQALAHFGGAVCGIGFAMPGPFDYPSGLALFSGVKKYDSLNGINVRDEMRRRLGLGDGITIRFLNDATCFAIGESWMGKASAYRRTMAITLGTGFGSAFLDDGIPVETGDSVPEAGCVYHLPFGGSIADDHFSTRWFIKKFRELSGRTVSGVREIAAEAAVNPAVHAIFHEFGNNLGNFLGPWLNRFGAGCLTIGGNIAKSYELFGPDFTDTLKVNYCATEVFLSELNEHAAIAGSARLADDSFYHRLPFISNK